MKAAIALLRSEPQARLFFLALAQSSLGTGAAYVGLLLIAYERFRSPWAISLILLADFLPPMLLGPMLGAAADRWSRRWCVVIADIARMVAFVGIALVDSFASTVAFALLAGAGTALFRPAALAGLPNLVAKERSAATTSLYSAVIDVGWTAGPAVAAVALLVTSPESTMLVNGLTFAVSAAILARLPLDRRRPKGPGPTDASERVSLFREGLEGWRVVRQALDVRVVVLVSAGAMFFGGVFNVIELPFATDELGAGESGYSVLVTLYGLGFIVGSLRGSSGGAAGVLRRRFVQGLALTGVGSLGTALSPTLGPALFSFALGGLGNGLMVVYGRLLIQERIPPEVQGRAFGLSDALVAWAFAAAFLSAAGLAALTGARGLMFLTAIGELTLAVLAGLALRGRRLGRDALAPARSSQAS